MHKLSYILMICVCAASAYAGVKSDSGAKTVVLANGRLSLTVDYSSKLNAARLTDAKTGKVYADGDYVWGLEGDVVLTESPKVTKNSASFTGKLGDIVVTQTFTLPKEKDVITETVTISNPTSKTIDTAAFRCGFTKKVGAGDGWNKEGDDRVCDVPFRRHSETGNYNDFALREFFGKTNWFSPMRSPMYNRQKTDQWGAEGWAWYAGGSVLLVSKYNPKSLEWSLIQPLTIGKDKYIRFGGAGTWKLGDPDGALALDPGESFTFGEMRYKVMDGDWKTAYYDYRGYMNSKGVALDKGYNPPVHWNELYDNPLWTVVGDSGENRQKYYRREDMAIEIAKAAELGCEAFYMDPGWDDAFGSFRWDESRLGDLADFIDWMGKTYGINKLALHTPIAPWCDPNQFPAEAMCMNEKGERYGVTCVASKQYREELAKRLAVLGNKGAYMYLFDGSWFEHMCYDPNHGHSVPKTRQDHIDGILANIRATKAYTPGVVIEQHDMITGPGTPRYTPMYMFYKVKDGIDELWAHEYMNEPLDDVISRRAAALYYNDMGIDTPIYLHIDLRQDNRNATALWWYYSTCRHMGMGGKSADPVIWNAQKIATKVYKANKAFYTQGAFYGIDETVHVHTLPNLDKAVVNFFNLEEKTQDMTAEFTFADIGLKPGLLNVEGGEAVVDGEKITLTVKDVPGIGNAFVKLHRADPKKAVKVSGKVTLSASGESVPGALVEIGGFGTLSGDDGSYELYIPAGTYTGAASFGEIASDSVNVTAKKGGASVDFVLNGSVIEGKVANTFGKAVEKAVVSHDAGIGVLTDEDGAYKLFVPAGRYTLNAAAFGSGVVDKKIRVAENKVVKCDFETEAQLGVWNASKDFHNLADSNSPWQYGYVGDNGLYTLIGVNERHGIDGIGGWGNANTSLMARNMNANAWMDSHSYLEAGQVGMHCNPVKGNTAVMRWTSPVTGKVVVYGRFTPQSFGPTTDSNVKLFFDSRPVAEGRVSGFFGRGVNHFRDAEGGALEFKFTDIRDIKSEDYYEFLSAPANGRADSQLVALDATIAAVVEIDDMSDAEGLDTNTHVLAEKGEVVSVDGSEAVVATEKGAVRFTKAADLKVGDKGSFVGKVTDGGIEFVFVK